MRFFFKRHRLEDVKDEVETVMEVLSSDVFIVLDLFLFCTVFTILLFPIIQSFLLSFLFFCGSYGFFLFIYFFVFNRIFKK